MTAADVDRAEVDRITWESWQAHGRNASRAARELDCSPSTVRARVKRHQAVVERPTRRKRERTSGSSTTEGPPPRCPVGGQVGLDGPRSTRCPVCSQDAAPIKRDGTLGSHKLLRAREGAT